MKKNILLGFAALVGLALTSCNGDYDDWASPQAFDPEDPAAQYGVSFEAGPDANLVMPVRVDDVRLVALSADDERVADFAVKSITINGEEVEGTVENGNIVVSAAELDALVKKLFDSRASVPRELEVVSNVSLILSNGDAVIADVTGTTTATVTLPPTPEIDPNGYYLLGDFKGYGWNPSNPLWMVDQGDGTYKVEVETTGAESNWFKFYEGSHVGSWDEANQGEMGCAVNGDASLHNFVVFTGDEQGVQTPVVKGPGKWEITLDMVNLTYTIEQKFPTIWEIGNEGGWSTPHPLMSADDDGIFTGWYVLDGEYKFKPNENNWDGDWESGGTIGEGEYSMITDGSGNFPGVERGFYQIEVNLNSMVHKIRKINTIGIIGDAQPGGWGEDTDMTFNPEDNTWYIDHITLIDGSIKFRGNDNWGNEDLNMGGTLDNLVNGTNDNISVSAGVYKIILHLSCPTKCYAEMIRIG